MQPPVATLRRLAAGALLGILLATVAACAAQPDGGPASAPAGPGTPDAPREVAIVAKDFLFLPDALVVTPGETLLIHVVNGGLALHEVVIGDAAVQDAWEAAEAATVGAPPGPTPVVSVPPDLAGLRVVVASGERVDVRWQVPADPAAVAGLVVGCHIPGHWAKGMRIAVVAGG